MPRTSAPTDAARGAVRRIAQTIARAADEGRGPPAAAGEVMLQLAREVLLLTAERDGTRERPRVGIAVLVTHQGRLLLGKRRGSHGAGEYAVPGGHLEHLESFQACAIREVLEETGGKIGPVRFLRVFNSSQYAPRHYVDLAFAAEWRTGEPLVREPNKVESWDWYAPDQLPTPLFGMIPSAVAALLGSGSACEDLP